jgi:hypothetical protein
MNDDFEVGVDEGRIIVRDPATGFFAIYSKPSDRPHLLLERRKPTDDHALLARSWIAAVSKARDLGWIV